MQTQVPSIVHNGLLYLHYFMTQGKKASYNFEDQHHTFYIYKMSLQVCHVIRIQRSDPIIKSFLELNFQGRNSTPNLSCRFTCNTSGRIHRSTHTVFVSVSDLLASKRVLILLRIICYYLHVCLCTCTLWLWRRKSPGDYLLISTGSSFLPGINLLFPCSSICL